MSYDDFLKHFTDFEICSVSVDKMYEDDSGQGSLIIYCILKMKRTLF